MRLPQLPRRRREPREPRELLELRHINVFLTSSGICEHGHLLFGIRLHTRGLKTSRMTETDLVVGRCGAARLMGALLALVEQDGGPAARKAFLDQVLVEEIAANAATTSDTRRTQD